MKSLSDTGPDRGKHDMKAENVGNKIEFATSPTLSEQRRSALINYVRKMAPFYSVYDVDLRGFGEETKASGCIRSERVVGPCSG